MPLQVTDLGPILARRLGGKPRLPLVFLCDAAGDFLTMAYEWEWTIKAKELSIAANADFVPLPADFGQIKSIEGIGLPSGVFQTTRGDIDWRRRGVGGPGVGAIFAVLGYSQDRNTNAPAPVLEVWPSSSNSRSNVIRLRYRARWPGVQSEAARVPLPPWPALEMAYIDILCAYAQGHDENDTAGRAARLAEIVAGADFQAAMHMDAGAVDTLGPLEHGAVDDEENTIPYPTFWG